MSFRARHRARRSGGASMKRVAAPAVVLGLALAVLPALALAAWLSAGSGFGAGGATQVTTAGAPTVTRNASTATVSWPQGKLAQGTVATGYTLRRTVGSTTKTVCTTTEPTRSCVDTSPAAGPATYQVVNVFRSWSSSPGASTSFTFDQTAPSTTASSSPAPNAAGWTTSWRTVTLNATDNYAGVASITYRVGSGSPLTVNGSTASFHVYAQGTTSVTYYATDSVGNVESTKTYTVKIDTTDPTSSVSSSPGPNAAGWNSSAVTLNLSATDAGGSGVASVSYKVGSVAWKTVTGSTASVPVSAQGQTTVTYYATDVAGNVESSDTYTVRLDTQAPALAITFPVNGHSYSSHDYMKGCKTKNSVCGTVTDNEEVDRVVVGVYSSSENACLLDELDRWGGHWSDCFDAAGQPSPDLPTATISGTTWTFTTGSLPTGSYMMAAEAFDKAGNLVTTDIISFSRS